MTALADSPAPAVTRETTDTVPHRQRTMPKFLRPSRWLPLTIMIVLLAVLWQIGSVTMPYLLPPLSAIGETLVGNPGYYLTNAWVTLQEALLGLVFAFIASSILAIAISEVAVLRRAIMPIAVVLNVTPLVAIAPALVVAFGFGPEPKLIVTAIICFFPILINVSVGLRSVPTSVVQFYTTVAASRAEMLWHVRVPNALPYLFAALKIVLPLSIVGAVVAEMFAPGAAEGLGTAISLASSNNKLSVIYASIFILAVMGATLLAIVTAVERRVLHWHDSHSASDD
ncbi:ABC transporter permease [Agromyces atrinae]|uniref:NitT/TauT family transport system permease protein n=2 Tax=Agromyces atrinae TaxID=592376 RepID=A0A852SDV7_9MICO|nr:ABC transporter permease [Agromyces atrinae]NYD65545.1 NitT/TauT family transport system permease protein [Agromyces atrinae]